MRALILNDTAKSALKNLREFAEKNPIDKKEMVLIMNGKLAPVGDREGYSCQIPVGFRVVYSIEQHPKQLFKHASFSINTVGKMPNPVAVQELMTELGFKRPLEKCLIQVEDGYAVNVLEPVDE